MYPRDFTPQPVHSRIPACAAAAASAPAPANEKALYYEALNYIELLHRCLLDVIKSEFDRHGETELNPAQGLLLFNIGEDELSAGELRHRGRHLGSNISYNLRKLVEMRFVDRKPSPSDRRSAHIRLTHKGLESYELIDELFDRHLKELHAIGDISPPQLNDLCHSLRKLEGFWTSRVRYRL